MECGSSLDAAPLASRPPFGSAEGANRQGRTGTARVVPVGGDAALPPSAAVTPPGATSPKPPPAPAAPKGAAIADPDWLQEVFAREKSQADWAKDEKANWEAARDAAVAAAEGGTLTARSAGGNLVPEASPLLLDGAAADPTSPGSDELAALMCGRLALLALQQITRPPGLAVFCSSTVRQLRPPQGHARRDLIGGAVTSGLRESKLSRVAPWPS